jgi:hypothetical protein
MPVSAGLTTTTWAMCGSRIRAISHALPVTSNATRSVGARLCANSSSASGVVAIRPAERSAPLSTIATSQKSRCTSSPIALPTALTSSPSARPTKWRTSGQTTTTDTCSRHIRASRRGGHRVSPSSKLIVHKRPAQLRSPRKPLSRSTDRKAGPGQQPSKTQFHAPSCALDATCGRPTFCVAHQSSAWLSGGLRRSRERPPSPRRCRRCRGSASSTGL